MTTTSRRRKRFDAFNRNPFPTRKGSTALGDYVTRVPFDTICGDSAEAAEQIHVFFFFFYR